MGKQRYIKITKSVEGQDKSFEAEVLPQSAKAWERNGWTVQKDESEEVGPEQASQAPVTATVVDQRPKAQQPVAEKKE